MAVRVRKLARELDRSSEDVLLLLRDLGHDRYRSEDDMLADAVVDQVRKAARTRPPRALIRTVPPDVRETLIPADRLETGAGPPRRTSAPTARPSTAPTAPGRGEGDVMAMLVPGVVRAGERPARGTLPPPTARPTAPPRAATATAPERREEAKVVLGRELERVRSELEAERGALAAVTEAVREQEGVISDLRGELEAARARIAELEAAPARLPADAVSLLNALEERGLRGVDEAERAVAALAAARQLGRWLSTLVVTEPAAVRKALSERLVLLGGPVPDGFGYPAVTVSSERADLPGAEALQRSLRKIGELSLLNGFRRMLVVGVAPRWQGLLREGIDRRIDLVFRAPGADDAGRIDSAVAWVAPTDPPRPQPEQRAERIDVRATSLGEFIDRWISALADRP
ncbi:MAG: hypothetical protein ABMA64_04620 [Myxococcota bacterium]